MQLKEIIVLIDIIGNFQVLLVVLIMLGTILTVFYALHNLVFEREYKEGSEVKKAIKNVSISAIIITIMVIFAVLIPSRNTMIAYVTLNKLETIDEKHDFSSKTLKVVDEWLNKQLEKE